MNVHPPQALVTVEEARSRIVSAMPLLGSQRVDITGALGRVLCEDVVARFSHPPSSVSAMDGYACRSTDLTRLPTSLKRIGTSKAGLRFEGSVTEGTCVRIFTGAAMPSGADTIVLQENAVAVEDAVEISEAAQPGQHIRAAGLDFTVGQRCIASGRVLSARDIGILASCGYASVLVQRKPRISILSTGDELVAPGSEPGPDGIMASNGVALGAAIAAWGATANDLGIVSDSDEAVARVVDSLMGTDLLVTTGGASVGDHDRVQAGLQKRGFVRDFWQIAMRPGKPLVFGQVNRIPVLGMPGNPVSALVCALLFLRPAIATMLGRTDIEPRFERIVLGAPLPANDKREDYIRARIETDAEGRLVGTSLGRQDSSMLLTLSRANGLIRRRPFAARAEIGESAEAIVFDQSCALF